MWLAKNPALSVGIDKLTTFFHVFTMIHPGRAQIDRLLRRTLPFVAIFLATMIGAASAQARGNSIRVDRFSVIDGLTDEMIFDVVQDHDGYMWIATRGGGLNKYDGYKFIHYEFEIENPDWDLADPLIGDLFVDRSGVLWLATESGLKRYDPESDSFSVYRPEPDNPQSLSGLGVHRIYEDRAGALWISTSNGLNRFDRDSGIFTHFQHDPEDSSSLSWDWIRSMQEDQDGTLWLATFRDGLQKLDPKTGDVTHYRHDPDDPQSLSHDMLSHLLLDRSNVLWVTTGGGLNRYDRDTDSFVRYLHDPDNPHSISSNSVGPIIEDQAGTIWVGGTWHGGGLNRFDPATGTFIRYNHDEDDPHSLSSGWIDRIYQDRSGALWVGTTEGLNRFHPRSEQFALYTDLPDDPNSLAYHIVTSVYEDYSGALWTTTGDTLYRIDREDQTISSYSLIPTLVQSRFNPNPDNFLTEPLDIVGDADGNIWVGTMYSSLQKFDKQTETISHYKPDFDALNRASDLSEYKSILPGSICCVHIDSDGVLWVAAGNSIARYDSDSQTFTHYWHGNPEKSLPRVRMITEIYEDRSGVFWLGTLGDGFIRFDHKKNTFDHFSLIPGMRRNLSDNTVSAFYEDQNETLWIGTDRGLKQFDRNTGLLTDYLGLLGRPLEKVTEILGDGAGQLWIASPEGLGRLNPGTGAFTFYDALDGIPSRIFSGFRSSSGEMFFGGEGLIAFMPEDIEDDNYVVPVVLTDFLLFNLPVALKEQDESSPLTNTIGHSSEVLLTPDQYMFSFEFAALHFRGADRGQYAYKLEGFDKDWVTAPPDRRIAAYSGVGPGSYTFRVKGTNGQGLWNEEGASIRVTILPPFWRTWWAYLTYGVAF
ncbi:MAG: triple tyrosine motif-containing protein, partial [Gammaproteobacteria bacterium]|nr:triple tyrosine motif-containing protein [Gammaproteobacteria bacterium]